MIVTGARGLMTPAHHVVFRMWFTVFSTGVFFGVTLIVVPWPWILIPGVLDVVLCYVSLQIIYAGSQWFFVAGHSAARRRNEQKPEDPPV